MTSWVKVSSQQNVKLFLVLKSGPKSGLKLVWFSNAIQKPGQFSNPHCTTYTKVVNIIQWEPLFHDLNTKLRTADIWQRYLWTAPIPSVTLLGTHAPSFVTSFMNYPFSDSLLTLEKPHQIVSSRVSSTASASATRPTDSLEVSIQDS